MPGTAVNVGTGTTITFGTSSYSANIENIDWSGISREAHRTTHMSSSIPGAGQIGGHTYIPSKFADAGSISVDAQFNPQTNPPVNSAAETITITFPLVTGDATQASWACTGFMTDFSLTDPYDGKMMCKFTVKASGNITMTDAT